jgi:hypothetical protein
MLQLSLFTEPVILLAIKWELGIILFHLEWLRVATRAVEIPHFVVSPFKIAHLR